MADRTAVIKRREAELVERVFQTKPEDLPVALASAIVSLAELANHMQPDDISVALDLPSGTLSFRAYKRRLPEEL